MNGWRLGGISGVENTNNYYVVDILEHSVSALFRQFILAKVNQLEEKFEMSISNFSVQANAYSKGFKGNIHNDNDYEKKGYPTHRIVFQFKNQHIQGGELIFYKKTPENPQEYSEIIRLNNINHSEVFFQISTESYHGISFINAGDRISLVINIWEVGSIIPDYFLKTTWFQ
jgi:Rps23 Pro-64 3,4-dihydroxylase Tpa1-like proline 4-hydroxylase